MGEGGDGGEGVVGAEGVVVFGAHAGEDGGVVGGVGGFGEFVAKPLDEGCGCVLASEEEGFDLVDAAADEFCAGGHAADGELGDGFGGLVFVGLHLGHLGGDDGGELAVEDLLVVEGFNGPDGVDHVVADALADCVDEF